MLIVSNIDVQCLPPDPRGIRERVWAECQAGALKHGLHVSHRADHERRSSGVVDLPERGLLQRCGLAGLRLHLKSEEPPVYAGDDVRDPRCAIHAAVLLPAEAARNGLQIALDAAYNLRFCHGIHLLVHSLDVQPNPK